MLGDEDRMSFHRSLLAVVFGRFGVFVVFMMLVFFGVFVMFFVLVFFGMFFMLVTVFVVMLFLGLHALHDFLFLDAVTECLHQVQCDTPFFRGSLKSLLNPFVRLAAHVNDKVGLGDGRDVLCRGLVTVKVGTVLDEQFQVNCIGMLADHVLQPVVLRVDGRDDGNLFRCGILFPGFRVAGGPHEC